MRPSRSRVGETKWLGVPRGIFLLGIVSFLTDLSSEMIFSVFSIFFTVVLGASAALLGVVEGLADFAASSLDGVAGFLSDKTGKRKIFALLGYGFSTLAKGILLFQGIVAGASFRVVERLGKSFRGAPRDAWIASLADHGKTGYAFGLHKALDKAGAIVGPLSAYFILDRLGKNPSAFQFLFTVALVPAALSVLLLCFIGEKPATPKPREDIFKAFGSLGAGFRHYLGAAGLFSLGYFSLGFLLLKASLVGFTVSQIPLLYALFNVAFVVAAPFFGRWGDRAGRRAVIALGYGVYMLVCVGFALASKPWQIIALFAVFGLFYAIDESQSKAYLSDLEPARRGTAIGLYNFVTGLLYLPASIIAGLLWKGSPVYSFGFGMAMATMALLFLLSKKERATP